MKKWMVVIFGLVLSGLFVGCGEKEAENVAGEEQTEEKKELRLVTDAAYAPLEYMEGDEIVGFDIDFIKAVAEEAGYELEIEHVGWEPIFVEIEGGTADLAVSSISIRPDRQENYDFSYPYFLSTNKILVREGSDIKSAVDLKDKVVAVQNGTTGHLAAEQILGVDNPNLKKFDNNNFAIQELISGGADAVVADNAVIEEYVKNNPDQNLVIIEDPDAFEAEYYGILFQKGSPLVADFNKAIQTIFDNGVYTEIYMKWFGGKPDIRTFKIITRLKVNLHILITEKVWNDHELSH